MIFLCSLFAALNCGIVCMVIANVSWSFCVSAANFALQCTDKELPVIKNEVRRQVFRYYISSKMKIAALTRAATRFFRRPRAPKLFLLDENGDHVAQINTDKSPISENAGFLYNFSTKLRVDPNSAIELQHTDAEDLEYRKIFFPGDIVSWPLQKNIRRSNKSLLCALLEDRDKKVDVTNLVKPWFYEKFKKDDPKAGFITRNISRRLKDKPGKVLTLMFSNLTCEQLVLPNLEESSEE